MSYSCTIKLHYEKLHDCFSLSNIMNEIKIINQYEILTLYRKQYFVTETKNWYPS